MKKLHILIPSLTIASTLPALMAVSCSNSWTTQWKLSDGEFVWKHDQPDLTFKMLGDLFDGYYQRIDNRILADDITYSMANQIWQHKEDYESAETKVCVSKIDKENELMSMDIWIKRKVKPGTEHSSGEGTLSYKNVPFVLERIRTSSNIKDEEKYNWDVILHHANVTDREHCYLLDWYKYNKQWSFTVDLTSDDKNVKGSINYQSLSDVIEIQDVINTMCNFKFPTYFFAKAEVEWNR